MCRAPMYRSAHRRAGTGDQPGAGTLLLDVWRAPPRRPLPAGALSACGPGSLRRWREAGATLRPPAPAAAPQQAAGASYRAGSSRQAAAWRQAAWRGADGDVTDGELKLFPRDTLKRMWLVFKAVLRSADPRVKYHGVSGAWPCRAYGEFKVTFSARHLELPAPSVWPNHRRFATEPIPC